jgi:hypothetical protein
MDDTVKDLTCRLCNRHGLWPGAVILRTSHGWGSWNHNIRMLFADVDSRIRQPQLLVGPGCLEFLQAIFNRRSEFRQNCGPNHVARVA